MANVIGILFFVGIGFLIGWFYGYRQVTDDIERVIRQVMGRHGRG